MYKNDMIDMIKKEQEEKTCISIGFLKNRVDDISRYFRIRKYKKILLFEKNRAVDLFVDLLEKAALEVECVNSFDEIQDSPDVILMSSEHCYDQICEKSKEKVSAPIFLLDDIVTDICWTPFELGNKGLREYEEEQLHTVNLYDQRERQHLYKILPKNTYIGSKSIEKILDKKALIVANLYYIADTDMYLQYLYHLPSTVHICIVTSNINIYDYVYSEIEKNGWSNIKILQKINRGRDISALLVTCQAMLSQYEYICFVHDKREKFAAAKQDGDFWIENLWGNTIASKEYLANIFDEFNNDPQLGLLVPPEPAGVYQNAWYRSSWGSSFAPTKDLARELKLDCPISIDKPPITLGTAFWCRYDALKKLFEKDWKYTSFPEEPLPNDGTISHAVERILGYVAQDAGYKTSIVMNDAYAAKLFSLLQVNMQKTFERFYQMFQTGNFYEVGYICDIMSKWINIFSKYANIYLYGAGKVGIACLTQLESFGMRPKAFIETECENGEQVKDIPVYTVDTIKLNDDDIIIISVGYRLRSQIRKELEKRKIENYIYYQDLLET